MVTKWEYMLINPEYNDKGSTHVRRVNNIELRDWKSGPSFVGYLNARGQEGWELVTYDGGLWIMKRSNT